MSAMKIERRETVLRELALRSRRRSAGRDARRAAVIRAAASLRRAAASQQGRPSR